MDVPSYKVTVARDLEDLIPVFMSNRKKELDTLRVALAAADFEQLRQLGHRMKGVGNSYGFAHVSTLGKRRQIARRAARAPRGDEIEDADFGSVHLRRQLNGNRARPL